MEEKSQANVYFVNDKKTSIVFNEILFYNDYIELYNIEYDEKFIIIYKNLEYISIIKLK